MRPLTDQDFAQLAAIAARDAAAVAYGLACGSQVRCCDACDEDGCCLAGCRPRVVYSPTAGIEVVERHLGELSPRLADAFRRLPIKAQRAAAKTLAPTGRDIQLLPESDTSKQNGDDAQAIAGIDRLIANGVSPRKAVPKYFKERAQRIERSDDSRRRKAGTDYRTFRRHMLDAGNWPYRPKSYTPEKPA